MFRVSENRCKVEDHVRSTLALALSACVLSMSGCGRFGYDLIDPAADGDGGGSSSFGSGASGGAPQGSGGSSVLGPDSGSTSGAGGAISGAGGAAGTGGMPTGTGGTAGAGGATTSVDASSGTGGTYGSAGSGGATAPADGSASQVQIIDVTDKARMVLSGDAQIGTGELDLTTSTRNIAGAAYLPTPYALTATTSFSVSFSFRVYGAVGTSGDGFAFLWQNDPRGTAAIGPGGGALGYGGVTPSVEVELDVLQNSWDPGGNDIALTTDGQYMTSLSHQAAPFTISDGATHYVWIDYDAATHTVSVYAGNTATRPAAALTTATVDLFATVGARAYLGFTAGTGVSDEYHAIESFIVDVEP